VTGIERQRREHAVSDERDAGTGSGTDGDDARGQTAVVTRPLRPTGKRSRRGADSVLDTADDATPETAGSGSKDDGDGPKAKKKTARKLNDGKGRPNPFVFVFTYLKEVVAELRKVIWPNRKQMISYTTVVLVFLAFMVALIGGVDVGLAKLVSTVFG
jgi:preprotein translocase subunit SecE